jgi:hypothetical protein
MFFIRSHSDMRTASLCEQNVFIIVACKTAISQLTIDEKKNTNSSELNKAEHIMTN